MNFSRTARLRLPAVRAVVRSAIFFTAATGICSNTVGGFGRGPAGFLMNEQYRDTRCRGRIVWPPDGSRRPVISPFHTTPARFCLAIALLR